MPINRLTLTDFRSFSQQDWRFSPSFNLLLGPNGSGKTSALEALFLLSRGRSFRTHLPGRYIQINKNETILFGEAIDESGVCHKLGLSRQRGSGVTTIKLDGDPLSSIAPLSRLLPTQLINPDSYQLLNDGPKHRRQMLDWGVFHVKHDFFPLWQRYQRLLKQRNMALKQQAPPKDVMAWDQALVASGLAVAKERAAYFRQLEVLYFTLLTQFVDFSPQLSLVYEPGWPKEAFLVGGDQGVDICMAALQDKYPVDRMRGYTTLGPHRGDLKFMLDGLPAQDVCSRGQQKMLVFALSLAQGALLHELVGKQCIYLIDDLPSELDGDHLSRVMNYLAHMDSQVFVTALHEGFIPGLRELPACKMFHVEQS